MKLKNKTINILNAQGSVNQIKPRGHSTIKKSSKPKKSNLQLYLEKKDTYPEKIKGEFSGVLKKALKELSEGIIKSNASEEYLEKLKRDEIIEKLNLRIKKMDIYRKVYLIRREQIEGPESNMNTDSEELETVTEQKGGNVVTKEEKTGKSQKENESAQPLDSEKNVLETNPEYWVIVDGKKIKVWEMDLDDLIELEDEIMGDEGELDEEMKDYINERNQHF